MAHNKENSCYSTSLLIRYARDHGINDEMIFKEIEEYKKTLCNPCEWTEAKNCTQLLRNIAQAFGGKPTVIIDIAKKISKQNISHFQLLFFKIAPLSFIEKRISQHYEKNISRVNKVYGTIIHKNEIDLFFEPSDPLKISKEICDFNKGCTYGTLELKGYKNLHIAEITCAALDHTAKACHYKVTWTLDNSIIRKIKDIFFFRFSSEKDIINHLEQTHTKLQEQYEEILSMRDFYSHIMEAMSEAVVWLGKNGFIDFANKSFFALTGIKEEESRGRRFSDFLLNGDNKVEYNALQKKCLTQPFVAQTAEFLIHSADGGKRIGQTSVIWVPSEHREPGYLLTIRDITEKKMIEQQLFSAKDKYRALYENSPAIVIGLDINGKFIYANPAMVEQSGYSEEELKTMHFSKLVSSDTDYNANGALNVLLSQPTRLQEVHFKTKTGEWKSITLTTYHIFDADNTLAGVAGIGVDITETKRLNEQLIKSQRMELLGQIAGGFAHDFNNILTSISGYSKLIINRSAEDKIKRFAETIDKAGGRASDLIKNLLAFSRGEINKIQKFDMNDIVKEVAELMKGITSKSIAVLTEVPQAPVYLLGDPGKIHQCVLNLCMNSKDAIGNREGRITIRVKNKDSKEGYVGVQVEDTGSGIPPEILDKIFDPFFTTKEKKAGTGLGLSVVYGMIKAHKGNVFVDSRPGEGTTFTIELPILTEESLKRPDRRKITMVLDNDNLSRNYCMEILLNSGCKAVAFSSFKDAETWLHDNADQARFILSNVVMPGMNIKDFIATCKSIKKDFTYVWMGEKKNTEIDDCIKTDPFLKKPFTPIDLIETIKSLKLP